VGIPVNTPFFGGNEKKYLMECIDSGWISSEGPFVKQFEDQFASKMGRRYGVAVCNGSAALDAAVAALRLMPGDEVILPAFTIISCAAAIVRAGLVPVLVDSDPETWNMTAEGVAQKITAKTKAIMVVHIYGLPVDMDPILALAKQYDLKIIEDAAQMHGQTYHGKSCGSFGDISTFSFYPNKHITTGEGGMILTDDLELATRCRSLRNLCFKEEDRFVHDELGWNLRMTNLQAALGLAQLEQLDHFVLRKREIGAAYGGAFSEVAQVQLPLETTSYADNIYWVFGMVLKDQRSAKQVMEKFREKGIGTRPFFFPMHLQPVFQKMGLFLGETYPVAEWLYEKGFYIPSGLGLLQEDQADVIKISKFILASIDE